MFELLDEDDREEEMSLVRKTKQEVEKADASYLAAVKKADLTRLQLEVGLVSSIGYSSLLCARTVYSLCI
jgi:hypothetical protein